MVELPSLQPNVDKMEPEQVKAKMPEAWRALEKYAREVLKYPNLHMFIFDTDEKGTLWAVNDVNLFWDEASKSWQNYEEDEPPHWKK